MIQAYYDKDGYLVELDEVVSTLGQHKSDSPDGKFNSALIKLFGNRWKLSKEDEAAIIEISNKVC